MSTAVSPPAVMPFSIIPPANSEKNSGNMTPAWKPVPIQKDDRRRSGRCGSVHAVLYHQFDARP